MEIKFVTPIRWIMHRKRLLAYTLKYGDGRITRDSYRALAEMDPVLLGRPHESGAAIAVARNGGELLGLAAVTDWGRSGCIVVIQPALRGIGIGTRLMESLLHRVGSLSCCVAEDNEASNAMCRKAGLIPVEELIGPTGKPTLRYEWRANHSEATPLTRRE